MGEEPRQALMLMRLMLMRLMLMLGRKRRLKRVLQVKREVGKGLCQEQQQEAWV